MSTLIVLLVLCHFLADFTPLSTPYMLRSKQNASISGIALHAAVHAFLMGITTWLLYDIQLGAFVWVIIFLTHGFIDQVQAMLRSSDERFQTYTGYWYWALLGADQFLHILVILSTVDYLHTKFGI